MKFIFWIIKIYGETKPIRKLRGIPETKTTQTPGQKLQTRTTKSPKQGNITTKTKENSTGQREKLKRPKDLMRDVPFNSPYNLVYIRAHGLENMPISLPPQSDI